MNMSPEMKTRIDDARAWLDDHKDKPPVDLARMMRVCGAGFMKELNGLSPGQWEFSPGERQWSPKEVSLHMAPSVQGVSQLVPVLAAGQELNIDLQPGVLGDDPGSNDAILEQLNGAFGAAVASMRALEEEVDEVAALKHPFFGPLNCREWAAFNILHTDIHRRQLQRIKSSDGFQAA